MPGGLIQIASYGSQDLTLTGNPQITFFKMVFRRYTNFGKRMIEVAFDNPVDFGISSTITIPKTGDLLSKVILKFKIPSFDLTELNTYILQNINTTNYQFLKLQEYNVYYDYAITFINKLKNIVSTFFSNNLTLNTFTYILDLKKYILKFINQDEFIQYFNIIDYYFNNGTLLDKTINTSLFKNASLFKIQNGLLYYIYENYNENDYSFAIFEFTINANMDILTGLNKVLYNILQDTFKNNNTIKMGWIDKLAINILDVVQLTIGSNIITTMGPNYIDINGSLNYKNKDLYNKLIGNNSNLNNPNNSYTDSYLYLPIPFWFVNNYGLALPLIALQYNTIQIKIKLKKLIDCIYFSIPNLGTVAANEIKSQVINLILSKTIEIFKSKFEVTMLLEYIYLDNIERKKFAQSSHEYLITQVQEIVFENVSTLNNNFELNFFHCCKELYWSAIEYKNINNIYGNNFFSKYSISTIQSNYSNNDPNYINYLNMLYNPYAKFIPSVFMNGLTVASSVLKANYINYYNDLTISIVNSINLTKNISPITKSALLLNGVTLINQTSDYFNYLQPYNYYNSTPDVGVNVYSFSLNPMESQPAGSCNLSRIPKTSMNFNIISTDSDLKISNVNEPTNITDNLSNFSLYNYRIYIQAVNYNILRFIGGIVGVAFTY
jgi:hypothetical protein